MARSQEFIIKRDIGHIKKTLANVDKTLSLQHASLVEHIKRTEMLETKLDPVERHVEQVRGIVKFSAFLVALSASIAAFLVMR